MPIMEWQAKVLEILNMLEDRKHFKEKSYTIRALAELLVEFEGMASFEAVRKYCAELRNVGVLKENGQRLVNGRSEQMFVFSGEAWRSYFLQEFEGSDMAKLVYRSHRVIIE